MAKNTFLSQSIPTREQVRQMLAQLDTAIDFIQTHF